MAGLASSSAGAAIISPRDLAASITIKLTGENYLYWHAQVAPLLRSFGLMGYVDGSEPCPADTITVDVSGKPVQQLNPDAQRWAKQDQAILSAFVSSMTEGVVGMVLFTATAHEARDTLAGAFASTSIARANGIRT
jgi:hypothetical protein